MTEQPFYLRLLAALSPAVRRYLASVTVTVDDSPGWTSLTATQQDTTWAELYQQQVDALEAWRQSPLARRIVELTSDYVVGDGITLTSSYTPLQRFLNSFWPHPLNQMDLRIHELCSELTRSGELFVVLNRSAYDSLTYLRFVPASEIDQLEWQPGDYETELRYHQRTDELAGKWWLSPHHPDAAHADQVMLHYAINRPIGATRGESDLAPILIWLRRYGQWLEDRARLNWAARAFLWFVTVPTNRVADKRAQYARPPEPGSVIVKDDGETWEMQAPNLAARDASADGRAMRYMIAAGAGLPLHMLSEGEGTNYATAGAQMDPTVRHYRRRQLYFCWLLQDIAIHSYNYWRRPKPSYRACTHADIKVQVPDISREDNTTLAAAGRDVVQMLSSLRTELAAAGIVPTDDLNRRTVELAFRFAGETLTEDDIDRILGVEYDGPV